MPRVPTLFPARPRARALVTAMLAGLVFAGPAAVATSSASAGAVGSSPSSGTASGGGPGVANGGGPDGRGRVPDEVARPDLLKAFTSRGTKGTMVVHQRGRGVDRMVVVGERRSRERYLPASTFKIPNALIALDLRIASGPEQAYPGPNPNYLVNGAPFLPAACEGDLTLRSALQNSCIPIFKRIARQVGAARYVRYVRAFDYGNQRTGGAAVDDFWLHGPFAISAREQVAFLDRLGTGRLPVSRAAIAGVRDILVTERTPEYTLRGKTGYVFAAQPGGLERGWWVGYVERDGLVSTFALNLDFTTPDAPSQRTVIGRELLEELGAF